MKEETLEIICSSCDEGTVEGAIYCTKPAFNCCGGCYTEEPCSECEGKGFNYSTVLEAEIKYLDLLEKHKPELSEDEREEEFKSASKDVRVLEERINKIIEEHEF